MNRTFSVWFGIKTSALKGMSLEGMLGVANYQRIKPYITEALSGRAVTFEDSLQIPTPISPLTSDLPGGRCLVAQKSYRRSRDEVRHST
jgi:hypothetical protein